MKQFLRRAFFVFLCAVILFTMLPTVYAEDTYEVCAAKRIISVVCDDSGSMVGDKWMFANYATQALIAQLNDTDELYITFMSNASTAVKINLKDLPGEVKSMENRDCPGGTPYQAIKTAYEKLENVAISDSNAQYWLIVTTDGAVANIPQTDGMNGTLQSVLDKHKGAKMPNGTGLNVAYLAMDAQFSCTEDKGNNLHTYTATTPQQISTSLSDISNMISSRLEADPVTQVDGKTISFSSKLPIYSISVLSQQSAATVQSATSQSGALNVDRNIALQKQQLFGNVAVVNAPKSQGKRQVIPAGTYTLTFSEDVNLNDLLIQYEPAIGVKMILRSGGKEIQDPATLQVGENISVELIPVIPGTDTAIDPADLPAGLQWRIEYSVDGDVKDSANGTTLPDTPIWGGDNKIRCSMQIPGFSQLVFDKDFFIPEVIYGMTVSQPDNVSYPRTDPHKSVTPGNSIVFTVTNDGVPMTKAELEEHKVALRVDSIQVDGSGITNKLLKGWVKAGIRFRMNDDGTFTLIPSTFIAFAVLSGKYTVTVSINNARAITAVGEFELVPSWADFGSLWWILAALALLIYLILVIMKKKFKGQIVRISRYKYQRGKGYLEGSYSLELTPMSGLLTWRGPWEPCRTSDVSGLVFVAGDDGAVTVSGKSIENTKMFMNYGKSENSPTEDLDWVDSDLIEIEKENSEGKKVREAADVDLNPQVPLYLKTNSGIFYCVELLA